jgi:glycosyltransferase involved in cell wall biosynthesis
LRVGLLIYGSLETLSGGFIYDRNLVRYLEAQGDEVEIVSIPWRDYPRHLADNFSSNFQNRLRDLQVDVLIQDELNHPSLFWLNCRIKTLVTYPIVTIVNHLRSCDQHPVVVKWLYRRIERAYLETLDAFVYVSRTTRATVEELISPDKPFLLAHPGGDRLGISLLEEDIRMRVFQGGPLRVIFLASVTRRKQLHVVLNALQQLPPENWELTVIGGLDVEPSYTRKSLGLVKRYRMQDNVHFLGKMNEQELVKALRSQDVMVVPSTFEGFGIVYLEGMGFGLPAIATADGAAREIISHGENGFLISPGDAMALAAHLLDLHEDREKLLMMSLAALESYVNGPTWEGGARRIREFLLELLV